jgi:hypothetical protein
MMHHDERTEWSGDRNELDRELDAALAKYAALEPRPGLEDRVLANLKAERGKVHERGWWRWSAVAALAAMVLLAVALAWRWGRPSPEIVRHRPSSTTQGAQPPKTQIATNTKENGIRSQRPRPAQKNIGHRNGHPEVVAAYPKLDQFPSPQPLSEQEKILADYVAQYPDQAALIAEARSEALRRDEEEIRAAESNNVR